MPSITDKFGKPSIDTNYALATTVKTARTPGEAVLACYDLSRFSITTPVYFVTYKKTTNPTTGEVSVTNQTSWKAIVNPGNNTFTNLTLAPGYTDIGNDIGDFVECIPTSFWGNSLIDAILTHANEDGTLKTSAVQDALNLPAGVPADYTVLATTPTTVVNNGQRSYTMTFPGVDYTDRLSPGMRLRTTRTVAAPTQCASLNGTNQYFSKAAPAGMTFTDDFTVSAWVKLDRYQSGTIVSRYNGTSGFEFGVGADGRPFLFAYVSGGNSGMTAYQSIPLNKWVHITAQLDMSAFTTTTTTSYIMLDGVDIPVTVSRGGTNPTALVQVGNLEVGSRNGGTALLPGKIAQVAIFNAKVTQATMRGYMSRGLIGTETSLVTAYSLSNSLNDLNTTNANNLTANNGATATNADSPFGGQADGTISSTVDYGIIQKITYGAPDTTVVVQVPDGCTIPTSGGVSAVSYSSVKVPYGFPTQEGKWRISTICTTNNSGSYVLVNQWLALNFKINIPTGEWRRGFQGTLGVSTSSAGHASCYFTLEPSPPTNGVTTQELCANIRNAAASTLVLGTLNKEGSTSTSTLTQYTLYTCYDTAVGSVGWQVRGDLGLIEIYARNAYL